MRVIMAGGGTGGHVIPALAIARELQTLYRAEILFVGTARGIETRLVPQAGFQLKLVQVGAINKVSAATRLKTLFQLPRSILAAAKILHDFKADIVIGVGGYASGPAMIAATLLRVPMLVFEPNLVPGFANRAVSRFVSAAAVHFEETAKYFRNAKVTGVPVRKDFFAIAQRPSSESSTLLLMGGSQGSQALNRVVSESAAELVRRIPDLTIIHQTGAREYEKVRSAYEKAGVLGSAEISPFIDDMPAAFARADILLCRSGASTVAEITAAGKVAIFVPFPHAADDHQRRNAEALSSRGAAVLIPEAELTPARLIEAVAQLLNEPAQMEKMAAIAKTLAHPNAAAEIAHMAAKAAGIS